MPSLRRALTGAAVMMLAASVAAAALVQFQAHLDGRQVDPPTPSSATGTALLRWGGNEVVYHVHVVGVENVSAAHLHLAPMGRSGPIVAVLQGQTQAGSPEVFSLRGVVRPSDLTGPFAGRGLQRLRAAIRSESVYVDVHTVRHPGGDVRGSVRAQ